MQMPSLAQSVVEYARLEFPRGTDLFNVDSQLIGHPIRSNVSVSPNRCLAIRQDLNAKTNKIEIIFYSTVPLTEPFRVLLLDWDHFPRSRAVMGYLLYEVVVGIVSVSDFRMSLARRELPDIFIPNTVYMLGIQFGGMPHSIHFRSIITDQEGTEHIDWLTVVRFALNGTSVMSDRNLAMRSTPSSSSREPINRPTIMRSRDNKRRTANFEEIHEQQPTANLQEIGEEEYAQAIVPAVGTPAPASSSQEIVPISNPSV